MEIKIKGLLISVGSKQNYKRGPVVQVRISEEGIDQDLPIDFFGNKCELVKAVKQGQQVMVTAQIIGRSYPGSDGATKHLAVLNGLAISVYTENEKSVETNVIAESNS